MIRKQPEEETDSFLLPVLYTYSFHTVCKYCTLLITAAVTLFFFSMLTFNSFIFLCNWTVELELLLQHKA